jgi:hypothetical protein
MAMSAERRTEYLRRAREAERRGHEAKDSQARGLWQEIAKGYWHILEIEPPQLPSKKKAV